MRTIHPGIGKGRRPKQVEAEVYTDETENDPPRAA